MQNDPKEEFCGASFCTNAIPGNKFCEYCQRSRAKAVKVPVPFPLTDGEAEILGQLSSQGTMPIYRFLSPSATLEPVFLRTEKDSEETVRGRGEIISSLEKRELVALDYSAPAPGSDDRLARESAAFAAFSGSAADAEIRAGSIKLTDDGMQAILDYFRQ